MLRFRSVSLKLLSAFGVLILLSLILGLFSLRQMAGLGETSAPQERRSRGGIVAAKRVGREAVPGYSRRVASREHVSVS